MARPAREVTDLPLFICGGIYDRASAEAVLQDVDIVLSGKSLMLNLNWVEMSAKTRRWNAFNPKMQISLIPRSLYPDWRMTLRSNYFFPVFAPLHQMGHDRIGKQQSPLGQPEMVIAAEE